MHWIERWPDWPEHSLVIVGSQGSGKSHLAAVWRTLSGARALTVADLLTEGLVGGLGAEAVVVEDVYRALGGKDGGAVEEALLHLFNWLREQNGWLVLTVRRPVVEWPLTLPDLSSRLTAAPLVQIGAPEDDLLEAVMVKLFADRQIRVAPDVVRYALARLERSFAALHAFVDQADRASLAAKRAVTVPLVRSILEDHMFTAS